LLEYVIKAVKSKTILSATIFGLSGLAFAAANIILARTQAVDDYAVFTLVIAIITMSAHFGLFGADGIVNRHEIRPDSRMLVRLFGTAAATAILASAVSAEFYDVGLLLAGILGIAVVCQSHILFAAAYLRSRHVFRASLLTVNCPSYIILIVAIGAALFGWQGVLMPVAVYTCLLVIASLWSVFHVANQHVTVTARYTYNWREALAFISISGSAQVLVQLERLVTPKLLTLEDLATLGVVLAIVGPPFRLLQLALGYALLPKLRRARNATEKNALILQEIAIALSLLVPCWLLTWYLVPVLDVLFLGDKYSLSSELILAVIVAGTAKALSGIGTASVAGVGSARHLEYAGVISWIGVIVSIAGAYAGAAFGLAGVVYGVSLGWFLRIIVAAVMVGMSLAEDDIDPVLTEAAAKKSLL
jgi:hypothetical protein